MYNKQKMEGIVKMRGEADEVGNRKAAEEVSENKSWFFGKINKIDRIARLTKNKRGQTKITEIRNERRYIITDLPEIRGILRVPYEYLSSYKSKV